MIIKIINITLYLLVLHFVLSALPVVTINSENHLKRVGVASVFLILMRKQTEAEPLAQIPH